MNKKSLKILFIVRVISENGRHTCVHGLFQVMYTSRLPCMNVS